MYHPYLFARRGELLAFRDIALLLSSDGTVIPVFEPVSSNIASLRLALATAEKEGQPLYLIMNPSLGDFENGAAERSKEWLVEAAKIVKEAARVRPTFLAGADTAVADLKRFVKNWGGRDAGVVFRNTALEAATVRAEVDGRFTDCRFFLKGATPSPGTLAALGANNCVFVEDRFQVQPSNAKYKGSEPFTGAHLTYKAQGYGGFGDFACLQGKFREGGSLPAAVAIHLTYFEKATKEVWVEHFVSKSQLQSDRDLPKKMREAIAAAAAATTRVADSFGHTDAYRKYLEADRTKESVDLQKNKRWSVAHHLDLMSGLLSGRFR